MKTIKTASISQTIDLNTIDDSFLETTKYGIWAIYHRDVKQGKVAKISHKYASSGAYSSQFFLININGRHYGYGTGETLKEYLRFIEGSFDIYVPENLADLTTLIGNNS